MKKLLLIFLMGIPALYSYAQDVPVCEAYPDFKPQCVQRSTDVWVYYLGPTNIKFPPADSVWITDSNGNFVTTVDVGEGIPIDITSLPKGYYLLCVQLGDCTGCCQFIKRYDSSLTDINNISDSSPSAEKFLQNGQLFILRGDNIYNTSGMLVK